MVLFNLGRSNKASLAEATQAPAASANIGSNPSSSASVFQRQPTLAAIPPAPLTPTEEEPGQASPPPAVVALLASPAVYDYAKAPPPQLVVKPSRSPPKAKSPAVTDPAAILTEADRALLECLAAPKAPGLECLAAPKAPGLECLATPKGPGRPKAPTPKSGEPSVKKPRK